MRRVKRKNGTRNLCSSTPSLSNVSSPSFMKKRSWPSHSGEPKAPDNGHKKHLDLHLSETVLPDDDIGGDTILTVVEEDDPIVIESVSVLPK